MQNDRWKVCGEGEEEERRKKERKKEEECAVIELLSGAKNPVETHHSRLFIEIHANGPHSIDDHRYEQHKDLHRSNPISEIGPMIAGVPAQLPLPVGLRRSARGTPPRGEDTPHHAHSVFPAIRVIEGGVKKAVPYPGGSDIRTHSRMGFRSVSRKLPAKICSGNKKEGKRERDIK